MIVKQAQRRDLGVLTNLAAMLWKGQNADELQEEYSRLLSRKDAAFFIAYSEKTPVGFAQCQLRGDYVEGTSSSPVGYLEGIFVKENFRRMGYAGELLKNCENWAKGRGCTEFASDCELSNEKSIAFHKSAGFLEANRIVCFAKNLRSGK